MTQKRQNNLPEGYSEKPTNFEFWKPVQGETIEGIYRGKRELRNGSAFLLDTELGLKAIGGYSAEIAFQGVEENSVSVWIEYKGKESISGGKTVNVFRFAFKDINQGELPF